MPSINVDLDFFDHPKTKRLVGLLGRGAEVLPIRLWTYCGKHHFRDGSLAGYSPQEIESIVGWWGKPGEFLEAMLRVKLIEQTPEGFLVHDWLDHAGHIAAYKDKARAAACAKRDQARARGMPVEQSPEQCPGRAPSTTNTRQCNAINTPPTPPPPRGGDSRGFQRPPRPKAPPPVVGAHPPGARSLQGPDAPPWVRKTIEDIRAGKAVDQAALDRLESYRQGRISA